MLGAFVLNNWCWALDFFDIESFGCIRARQISARILQCMLLTNKADSVLASCIVGPGRQGANSGISGQVKRMLSG